MKKKVVLGVAAVVGVCVVILAVLPFVVDLNRYKDPILSRIRTYVNRDVSFEGINLTILTGLGAEIRGLRIADDPAFAEGDFLALKSIQVKVALLPLLRKEVKIRKVVVVEPTVHVIKSSAGTFNYTTLLVPRPEKPEKEPKPGALASLLAANIEIKNGSLSYRDDKAKPGAKPFVLSDIDLDSQDISAARPIPFSLSAAVMSDKGQNLSMAGTIGPLPAEGGLGQAPMEVHVLLDALPLASLPMKMPFQAGTLKIDLTAQGALKGTITSRAKVDLSGLVLGGPEGTQPQKEQKGISCVLASDLIVEPGQQRLLIRKGAFTLGREQGTFEGAVEHFKSSPTWNMTFASGRITPGPIMGQLSLFKGLVPGKITLVGPAGFTFTTAGNKEAFQVKADVDLQSMGIVFGKVFQKPANSPFTFSSSLSVRKDFTEITALDFNLGGITARGSGEVRKVQGKSHYRIVIQTNPVPLQTAQSTIPMLQSFKPGGALAVKTTVTGGDGAMTINVQGLSDSMSLVLTKPPAVGQAKGKVLAGPVTVNMRGVSLAVDAQKKGKGPLRAGGTLKSRQGTLLDLPFTNLTSTFSYENGEFKVNSFDLAALRGSIKGAALYNTKTKAWSASPVFNNVQAGNVLDALTNFKGVFAGTMSGDVRARGVAGAPAMENLGAQVSLKINKGEWKNFDLGGSVLGSLMRVPGLPEAFGLAPAEVQKYQTTRFESMSTQVDLARKVINVDTMQILNISSGRDVDTESRLKGTISMETNQLDLKGQVVLPKRFSQRLGARGQAFSALMNDQNRLVLPLTLKGTLKKPVPMVDVNVLGSALARYYTQKALGKGLQKLQDKAVLPPGTPQDTGKAIENLLDGLLKKK
ncbi:MAG: AsmA family protein [Syntrophaceae bacterium]